MTTAKPTISLIINTTDRAQPLQTLLRGLDLQSYPDFEVIVVVGPTRDNTLEILQPYQNRTRVLQCSAANLSQSRNIGLLAARGDIVAFLDDDCVPSRNWLAQLAELFKDPQLDATGGKVYMVHPSKPVIQHRIGIVSSLAEQVDIRDSWLDSLVPSGEGRQWTGRMMGTNMAFRRIALLDIGGFDEFFEWLYDDTDIAIRLDSAGKVIRPVKEAVVYHIPASSRNRVAHSFNARWWVQTQSVIYYSLKNAPLAGDSRRNIALRSLHYVHGHWLWAKELWQTERLTFKQLWRMRFHESRSALIGAHAGLFHPRKLIEPEKTKAMMQTEEAIKRFQNEQSVSQPTVDPVSGRQADITLTEPPLRVCLLSTAYPPAQYEGVGRLTNMMARGLFELGHTVHVITKGEKDQVSFYDGAYVHRLAPKLGRYERYRPFQKLFYALNHSHEVHEKVKRLMLNDGVQVVDSPVWMVDGMVTAVAGNIPVVVRLVTALRQIASLQQDQDADARLVGEMEQMLVERAAYLASGSQAIFETARKVYGITPDQSSYRTIPFGIVPVADEAIRPFDPDAPPETLTILYLGRLEKRKGIVDLFEAIPQVFSQVPHVRFVIAGADNSRRDGFYARHGMEYSHYFRQKYPAYQTTVEFTGEVSDERLHQLYQSCDLFVAPSLYESFGLIYLEAMNYAKPVIGCQAGGIPEVVAGGENGLLVEPAAPTALAEAMISLLKSPQKLRDMGLAGRARLLEKFTYLQMAQAFAEVYKIAIHNFRK